jgi:enamine deaminase RidA (YjgF/YER057c/UK114 family)
MSGTIDARLAALDITLPEAPAPRANYRPWVITGNFLYISGNVPLGPGGLEYQGAVGRDFGLEEAQAAARLCAINILAQIRAALDGDFERVRQIVKLGGFVNCTPDFTDHPAVINAASDLMVEVFGEAGRHARFAVGAASLPFNVAVEIDAVVEFS